jgi:two-component system chemotaxis response regulator CheY
MLDNKKDLKILIVDDLPALQDLMLQSLNNLGFFNITQAADGKIAWDLLLKENFDLLITDWMMPNMDGLELTMAIRADNRLKDLKILMVTSNKKQSQISAAIKAGVNEYLLKPYTLQDLEKHLTRILL